MMKVILGLISIGGLSLGTLYVYTGFESGRTNLPGGGCCHSGSARKLVEVRDCGATDNADSIPSCCALPSRSVAAKNVAVETSAKGVEVLTIAPREIAAK